MIKCEYVHVRTYEAEYFKYFVHNLQTPGLKGGRKSQIQGTRESFRKHAEPSTPGFEVQQ